MGAGQYLHKWDLTADGSTDDNKDANNRRLPKPITIDSIWFAVEPQSGREFRRWEQRHTTMTHLLRCQYDPRIKPSHWLLQGTRRLDIVSIINPEERNRELLLICKETVCRT